MEVKLLLCSQDRSIQPGKCKTFFTLKRKKKIKKRENEGNAKTALALIMGMAASSLRRQISHR